MHTDIHRLSSTLILNTYWIFLLDCRWRILWRCYPRTAGRKSSDRFSVALNSVRTISDLLVSPVSSSRFSSAWVAPATLSSPAWPPTVPSTARPRYGSATVCYCSLLRRPPGSSRPGPCVSYRRSTDCRGLVSNLPTTPGIQTRYFRPGTTNSRIRWRYSKKRKISDCYYQCLPVNNGVLVHTFFNFG